MAMLLAMLTQRIPIMVKLLRLYWCGPFAASSAHPVYKAYVVVMLPKFPSPETNAEAAATPTSRWRLWKISLVQVMQIGTVGPSPNPIIRRPPYLAQGSDKANVTVRRPAIWMHTAAEKNRARCRWNLSEMGVTRRIAQKSI